MRRGTTPFPVVRASGSPPHQFSHKVAAAASRLSATQGPWNRELHRPAHDLDSWNISYPKDQHRKFAERDSEVTAIQTGNSTPGWDTTNYCEPIPASIRQGYRQKCTQEELRSETRSYLVRRHIGGRFRMRLRRGQWLSAWQPLRALGPTTPKHRARDRARRLIRPKHATRPSSSPKSAFVTLYALNILIIWRV